MDRTAVRVVAVGSLACLLALPHRAETANLLRNEAVTFRQEGYDRQRHGDFEGAISAYQKATSLDPAYAAPNNDLGVIYEQLGDLESAEHAYQQALKIDPNYVGAHANLALLYERMGDQDKAIVHWLKRYQLGNAKDPWTVHAEERLIAFGVLKSYPGLKSKVYTRGRVVEEALEANRQSIETFRAMVDNREKDELPPTRSR